MYIDNKYNLVLPKTIDLPKEVYLYFLDKIIEYALNK